MSAPGPGPRRTKLAALPARGWQTRGFSSLKHHPEAGQQGGHAILAPHRWWQDPPSHHTSVGTGPLSPESTKDSGSPVRCLPTGRGLSTPKRPGPPKSTRDHVKSRPRGREAQEALWGCSDANHTRQEHRTELRLPLSSVRVFLHHLTDAELGGKGDRDGKGLQTPQRPLCPLPEPCLGETLNTNLSPSVTESGMNGYGFTGWASGRRLEEATHQQREVTVQPGMPHRSLA